MENKMNDAQKKKLADHVCKNIDMILKQSQELAKMFKSHAITKDSLTLIVEQTKPIVTNDVNKPFLESICQMFDLILKTCVETADKMDSKVVPIELIRKTVQTTKQSFLAGYMAPENETGEITEPIESPVNVSEEKKPAE